MNTPGHAHKAERIAVLGPGAVGGLLAALFWRSGHTVTCIAREEAVFAINRDGLRLESATLGDFIAHPQAAARLDTAPDVLFIATKATTLSAALERVQPEAIRGTVVIPLLNGIEHMAVLRKYCGRCVAAGSIGGLQSHRASAIHVVHTSRSALIELASDEDVPAGRLTGIASLITTTGIAAEVLTGEALVLWRKLVRLAVLAGTTAASGRPLEFVRSDPEWRKVLRKCVQESAAVATAEGVPTDAAAVLDQIEALPATLTTSLARDIAAARSSELDAIVGAVLRAGARHHLDCPALAGLYARLADRTGFTATDFINETFSKDRV